MTEAGGATTSSLDLSLTQTRCPQGMDMSLASLLQCLDSGHRSPVPVCNLEPLYCPKYTLVSQEGPLLGVQAFHLRSEEGGASFLLGPNNPASEVSQDGLLGKEGKKRNGSALSRDSGRQNCQPPKKEIAHALCFG